MRACFVGAVLALLLLPLGAQSAAPVALPLPPPPTATGPSKLAFINFQQAIAATGQGAKMVAALRARFVPKQAEFKKSNAEIQALETKLSDGSSTMSATAKQQLSQEIQTQQRDLQQSAQDAQSDYQAAVEGVLQQVGTQMLPIIRSYAQKHGYTLVIDSGLRWPRSPMLVIENGANITAAVVRLYNQAHPEAAGNQSGH
ncbi:MAG: OmpH family outer membrane protein [Terriglobales bacterium]